jgi:hypothetical protein
MNDGHMAKPTGQTKRRHHTVPAFYLRGFADDETLLTITLPGAPRFKQSVKNATVETDFYAIPGHEDGDDVLEDALAILEGKVAPVIARIMAKEPLLPGDRGTLGYYIAIQGARSPAQKRNADALKAQIARLEIGQGGRARFGERFAGLDLTQEQLDELWDQAMQPEGPPLEISSTEFASQMLANADHLVPYIVGRPWTLIYFDRRALITSDDPVNLVPSEDANDGEGIGYATAGEIIMPIGRRVALVMGNLAEASENLSFEEVVAGSHDTARVGTTELERALNEQTARTASKWIYVHPDDERFVPQHLPEPTPVSMHMTSADWHFDGSPGGRFNTDPSTGSDTKAAEEQT